MSFEKYTPIKTDIFKCIRPQKSISFVFDGTDCVNATRLFLTGETNISHNWKTEPDYQVLYRRIDDSLRCDVANNDRFCLDFSSKRCQYSKIAFKKIVTPFRTPMFVLNNCTDNWTFGISAKAKNLKVYGFLRVCVEIRLKKEGVSKFSTVPDPDATFTIDIDEGSYDWKDFKKHITFAHKDVANVCFILEGEDYEGEVYFEAPLFESAKNFNIVGQFLPHTEDRQTVNWIGQNLSKIEWIGLKVEINDKTVFDGEIFERCHRFSEAEIFLPENVIHEGENTITLTCTSSYRDAAGYILKEWGFITEKDSLIISTPPAITVNKPFYICVEGKKGDKVEFSSLDVEVVGDTTLKNDGLNALCFVCNKLKNNVSLTLNGEEIVIPRCVERDEDGIITGTGDMIYIHVDDKNVNNYLKWYLSQNIGNLLTIRPTYRWNGTRTMNSEVYKKTASLLDSMGIYYSHMLDGRELPGANCNPSNEELDTPHFLGRQTHERDGAYNYWGNRDVTGDLSQQMFYDLFLRMNRKFANRMSSQFIPQNIHYNDKKQYIFNDPVAPDNMKDASDRFVNSLANSRGEVVRHTGPATLFKYFYQAGYKWTGAELMYSPTELTSSSLRGARDLYGGKTGAHLAVQWSTSPHDVEERYRRYRLALFICYMQGIDEINTEEGLWRLEEYYNYHHRFSPACTNHTLQQQDLYKFITTHTRRGRFYTPIAFLNGRYDGWRTFSRGPHTWGITEFGFSDAEKAWDILTYYYPKSVLDALYVHNCPTDRELGYYSGTPYGNVDIIPIESDDYSKYRLLIAPGYNKAEQEDLKKLEKYVASGGVLMIGWPQLSTTVNRQKVTSYEHTYYDNEDRSFVKDTYCSHPVSVCENVEYDSVLVYTDSNRPLVVLKNIGKGLVCFVNAKEYVSAPAVDLAYRQALKKLTDECLEEESIYAKGDRNVQFTVFECENGCREIYFIATDWHKPNPDGIGTLIIKNNEYAIDVPWGQMIKVCAYNDSAMYPVKDENEVVSFDGTTARVQGCGLAEFILCKDGVCKKATVDFSDVSVKEISVSDFN